jgi:hypothetical protein
MIFGLSPSMMDGYGCSFLRCFPRVIGTWVHSSPKTPSQWQNLSTSAIASLHDNFVFWAPSVQHYIFRLFPLSFQAAAFLSFMPHSHFCHVTHGVGLLCAHTGRASRSETCTYMHGRHCRPSTHS